MVELLGTQVILLVENGAIFDGTCDMTGNDGKIIKLVKTEEAESAASV